MRSQNRKAKIVELGSTSTSVRSLVGRASSLGLLTLGLVLVNPVISSVYAEEVEDYGTSSQALATSTVNIAFSPTTASGSLTPVDASGAKTKVDVLATVKVANSAGFRVYVGSDTSDLVNKSCPSTATAEQCKVQSVASATKYANLPENRWGYAFIKNGTSSSDATVYSPMPSSVRDTVLDTVNETNRQEKSFSYLLSFAANIDADRPAGTYENQVTMSVVSSPLEITNAFGIEYMQDMTASVCNSVATPAADASIIDVPTAQLIDKRDGKKYWVAKLADGNCWMTQDLDLDIPEAGIQSGTTAVGSMSWQNSDMTAPWKPTAKTETTVSSSTVSSVATDSRSWDQGTFVYIDPKSTDSCTSSSNANMNVGTDCDAYFQDVSGSEWTASTDPDFVSNNEGKAVNTSTHEYDAHYLVGNWYQWPAATAGTGTADVVSTGSSGNVASLNGLKDATSSICPKGWHLPTSGRTDSQYKTWNQKDSFGALLSHYGWTGTSTVNGQNSVSTDTITADPLFFVRSGGVDGNNGYLIGSGNNVYYWSSTADTTTNGAYSFYFSTGTNVVPSNSSIRYNGLSVRCIAD